MKIVIESLSILKNRKEIIAYQEIYSIVSFIIKIKYKYNYKK